MWQKSGRSNIRLIEKSKEALLPSVRMTSAITLHGGRLLPNMAMHQISNGGLILFIGRMKMRGGMILTETMNHSVLV
ncbi:unnamed protein product [Camellia sinensis]